MNSFATISSSVSYVLGAGLLTSGIWNMQAQSNTNENTKSNAKEVAKIIGGIFLIALYTFRFKSWV